MKNFNKNKQTKREMEFFAEFNLLFLRYILASL